MRSSSLSLFFSSKKLWYSVLASYSRFILPLMLYYACAFFSSSYRFSSFELFSTNWYLLSKLGSLAWVTSIIPKLR
jgi:hypothetical protein